MKILMSLYVWLSEETRLKSQKKFSCKMTECKVFSLCFWLFKKLLKIHKKSTSGAIWKNKRAFNKVWIGQTLNKAYLNICILRHQSGFLRPPHILPLLKKMCEPPLSIRIQKSVHPPSIWYCRVNCVNNLFVTRCQLWIYIWN